MDYKKVFGERLCDLKERAGCEQWEDLCEMTGIPYSSMMQYCTGKIMPRVDVLIKLADYFSVPLDYLTGRLDLEVCYDILVSLDYGSVFMNMRSKGYEQFYQKARKRMDIPQGYEAPWPYNLYDDVNETITDFLLTNDQIDGMWKAIRSLSTRDHQMLIMRYKDNLSLAAIGDIYDLTPERIRQIIRKAVFKLRHSSRKDLMNYGLKGVEERNGYSEEILRLKAEIGELERRRQVILDQNEELVSEIKVVNSMADISAMPLYDMDLSVRAYNCLRRGGCETVKDVHEMYTSGRLTDIRNLGKHTEEEIRDKLKEFGFDVSMEEGA